MRDSSISVAQTGEPTCGGTDFWRRPLPLQEAHGTATLRDGAARPLVVTEDRLRTTFPPFNTDRLEVQLEVRLPERTLTMNFVLPIQAGRGGAAAVDSADCAAPPQPIVTKVARLRCTLSSTQPDMEKPQ